MKTGRFSKFLPSRMAADFDRAIHDPQLVTLRKEIATLDARMIDLFKRVDTGEAGMIWRDAQAAVAAFDVAQTKGDVEKMREEIDRLKGLVGRGASDYPAWARSWGSLISVESWWIARCVG
jgi:hypothetical protein